MPHSQTPNLVPLPTKIERGTGQFSVTAQTPLVAIAGQADTLKVAAQLGAMLADSHGVALPQAEGAHEVPGAINLHLDEAAGLGSEAYMLSITADSVSLRASDAAGLYYAAVTLWQLLSDDSSAHDPASAFPESAAERAVANAANIAALNEAPPAAAKVYALPVALPALRIADAPRFRWRGLMVDSARHMQSLEQLKRLVDQAARHKLNRFHWHLVDDQGWRLEIKRYPKLTEVGAWRQPLGRAGLGPDGQPRPYGGFYTQDEARELVAYAAERHITVVPEIEMPGHVQAPIAAYPELGCTETPPPVSPKTGIHPYLYNAEDSTFAFLENVLREVFEVFPSRYIHIGGDEAWKPQWRASASIQARIRELGLADETALQSWFIRRIGRFITESGRILLGWDEILDGGPLPENATVMVWREMHSATQTAQSGHDVIVCPQSSNYLNRLQSLLPDEPSCRSGLTPLERVYGFDPIPPGLTPDQAQSVIGMQANVWTEFIPTGPHIEHMLFPRLSAIAERAWSPADCRDWQGFLPRIAAQLRRLRRSGINAADSAFAVQIDAQAAPTGSGPGTAHAPSPQACVELSTQSGLGEIRYTLDGSEPHAASTLYSEPLSLALPASLKANAFYEGRPIARARSAAIDAVALHTRRAEQLIPNYENVGGRYQAVTTPDSPRLTTPVDISNPHWVWREAPLAQTRSIRATIIDLPDTFVHPVEDLPALRARPEDPVYLQVYVDNLDGEPIAQALVGPSQPALQTLDIALPAELATAKRCADLYLKFSGDPRNGLWCIQTLQLR